MFGAGAPRSRPRRVSAPFAAGRVSAGRLRCSGRKKMPVFHQNGGGPGWGQSVPPAARVVCPDPADGGCGARWSSGFDPRSQTPRRQRGQGGAARGSPAAPAGLDRLLCSPAGARRGVSPGRAPPLAAIARSVLRAFAAAPGTGSVAAGRGQGDRGTWLRFSLASDPAPMGVGRRLLLSGDSGGAACLSRPQPLASRPAAGKAALPPPGAARRCRGPSSLRGAGRGQCGGGRQSRTGGW